MQPGLWPNPLPALPLKSRCLWAGSHHAHCRTEPKAVQENQERQCKTETSYTTAGFYSESVPYTVNSKEK